MDNVYIGKVVNTHGIKGEIRIQSNFPYKDKVFLKGNTIIIGEEEYIINSYRVHKGFDMVTLDGFSNINDVLFLMKKAVYYPKDRLNLGENEILDEDLINYTVLTKDGRRGIIKEIFYASASNKILRVELEREVLIPFNSPMILKIDKSTNSILIELIEGM